MRELEREILIPQGKWMRYRDKVVFTGVYARIIM